MSLESKSINYSIVGVSNVGVEVIGLLTAIGHRFFFIRSDGSFVEYYKHNSLLEALETLKELSRYQFKELQASDAKELKRNILLNMGRSIGDYESHPDKRTILSEALAAIDDSFPNLDPEINLVPAKGLMVVNSFHDNSPQVYIINPLGKILHLDTNNNYIDFQTYDDSFFLDHQDLDYYVPDTQETKELLRDLKSRYQNIGKIFESFSSYLD